MPICETTRALRSVQGRPGRAEQQPRTEAERERVEQDKHEGIGDAPDQHHAVRSVIYQAAARVLTGPDLHQRGQKD
jgi:hypothetical protein